MKKSLSTALCMILVFELSLGSIPARADAPSTGSPTTPPAEFLKQVQEESEAIFGKNGCAKINDKGEITLINRTTAADIQTDQPAIDCAERVKAHIPRAKAALALVEEYQSQQKAGVSNSSCVDCDSRNPQAASADDAIPAGGMCSRNEKLALEKLRAKNPQCSLGCELKGSLKKSVGSLGGLLSSNSSCNVDKAGTSAFGCLKDFVVSLFTSLGSMCAAVWDGVKAAGSWAAGLFKSHKEIERNASNTSGAFANMSEAEIKAAQKNPAQANQSLLAKIGGGLNWVMENIVGLDTPTYSEMWGCAKCGERIAVICKLTGVLGKDIVKNAILIWIGGKALGGIAKLGKGMLGGLAKGGSWVGKQVVKTAAGKALVSWGANKTAWLASKSAVGFENFLKTKAGAASAKVAQLGVKGTVKSFHLAAKGFEKIDNAMMYFPRMFVRGGKAVAAEVRTIAHQAGVFRNTPRLTAEEAAQTGLKKITEVTPTGSLEVEVINPVTREMEKAKNTIEQKKWAGKNSKEVTEDIENALEQKFEPSGAASVKVGNGPDAAFLKVENPEKVSRVFTYNEGRNALVRMNDGSTLLMSEGKIIGTVPAKEAKVVDSFLGPQQAQADELALQNMKKNAQENGLQVREANSTPKDPTTEFKVNSGPECGNQEIVFSAGKAI